MSLLGSYEAWIDELHEILEIPNGTHHEESKIMARRLIQERDDWKALALLKATLHQSADKEK